MTTGVDVPSGRPSTTKAAPSRNSHSTLLVEPSTRGLAPATRCRANRKARALLDVLGAQGTGQGAPFVWLQPLCAHLGGSASVTTVPAQPPARALEVGPGWGVVLAACCGLHPDTSMRSKTQTQQPAPRIPVFTLCLDDRALTTAGAIHGASVARIDEPVDHVDAVDALVTDRTDVVLFTTHADCYPIVLWDPEKNVAGLVHAGWRGTQAGVAGATV